MQEELSHSFDLADVAKYGSIEKALIIKEIRQMQAYKARHGKEGWVYYSSYVLAQKFPYMAAKSIQRWMRELIEAGHLEKTIRNKAKYDRTPSYRLPGAVAQSEPGVRQNEARSVQNRATIPSLSTPLSILTTNVVKGSPAHAQGQASQQTTPAQYPGSSIGEAAQGVTEGTPSHSAGFPHDEVPPFASEVPNFKAALMVHIATGPDGKPCHRRRILSPSDWNRFVGATRNGRTLFMASNHGGGLEKIWLKQVVSWEFVLDDWDSLSPTEKSQKRREQAEKQSEARRETVRRAKEQQ